MIPENAANSNSNTNKVRFKTKRYTYTRRNPNFDVNNYEDMLVEYHPADGRRLVIYYNSHGCNSEFPWDRNYLVEEKKKPKYSGNKWGGSGFSTKW